MMHSPFLNNRDSSKPTADVPPPTFIGFFRRKLYDFLYTTVPLLSHLPPHMRMVMGILYILLVVSVFLALFVYGYYGMIKTVYLSPLSEKQTTASANCEIIQTPTSGNFLATKEGLWQSQDGFVLSDAAYLLTVSELRISLEEYEEFMMDVYNGLQRQGKLAEQHDLGQNLLVWMAWAQISQKWSSVNRLQLEGEPRTVFNRRSHVMTLGNQTHDCLLPSRTAFNPATGVMTAAYDAHDFFASPVCSYFLDPQPYGYDLLSQPEDLLVDYDVHQLVTTVALNDGTVTTAELVEITSLREVQTDPSGELVDLRSYYHPKFPGMRPVTVVVSPFFFGYVSLGDLIAFPFFHHVGADLEWPTHCNCSAFSHQDLQDNNHPCHRFAFIAGFLYFNVPTYSPEFPGVVAFLASNDASKVQRDSFAAAFAVSMFGRNSRRGEALHGDFRAAAFEFCRAPIVGTCNIAVFSSYDPLISNVNSISEELFTLTQGACRDSISTSQAHWQALIDRPFVRLQEQYQQCSYSAQAVLVQQTGIAVGNISIFTPLIVASILLLVAAWRLWRRLPTPLTYSRAEKEGALDDFAIALLMVRDGLVTDLTTSSSRAAPVVPGSGRKGVATMLGSHKVAPDLEGGHALMTSSKRSLPPGAVSAPRNVIITIVRELARNVKNMNAMMEGGRDTLQFLAPDKAAAMVMEAVAEEAGLEEEEDGEAADAAKEEREKMMIEQDVAMVEEWNVMSEPETYEDTRPAQPPVTIPSDLTLA